MVHVLDLGFQPDANVDLRVHVAAAALVAVVVAAAADIPSSVGTFMLTLLAAARHPAAFCAVCTLLCNANDTLAYQFTAPGLVQFNRRPEGSSDNRMRAWVTLLLSEPASAPMQDNIARARAALLLLVRAWVDTDMAHDVRHEFCDAMVPHLTVQVHHGSGGWMGGWGHGCVCARQCVLYVCVCV